MIAPLRRRRRRNNSQTARLISATTIRPNVVKTPATALLLLMKPPLLFFVCATAVSTGGAVGVTYIVVGAPATVITDGDGVGDHVEVGALAWEVEVGEVLSGTIGATGVVEVLVVDGVIDVAVERGFGGMEVDAA